MYAGDAGIGRCFSDCRSAFDFVPGGAGAAGDPAGGVVPAHRVGCVPAALRRPAAGRCLGGRVARVAASAADRGGRVRGAVAVASAWSHSVDRGGFRSPVDAGGVPRSVESDRRVDGVVGWDRGRPVRGGRRARWEADCRAGTAAPALSCPAAAVRVGGPIGTSRPTSPGARRLCRRNGPGGSGGTRCCAAHADRALTTTGLCRDQAAPRMVVDREDATGGVQRSRSPRWAWTLTSVEFNWIRSAQAERWVAVGDEQGGIGGDA